MKCNLIQNRKNCQKFLEYFESFYSLCHIKKEHYTTCDISKFNFKKCVFFRKQNVHDS